jgi:translation initiation factor IF-3
MEKQNLINYSIHFPTVLLIDADGNKVGIMATYAAMARAGEAGLDLVCISQASNPPVCKLMDYNKFLFEKKKKDHENKKNQFVQETKEIQLRPQIADHDLETKENKAREELLKGNKIRVVVSFKGRQMAHSELGYDLANKFASSLSDVSTIANGPEMNEHLLECYLNPKKQ